MESKEIELRTLRHSSEHVLAEAILKLYPNTKMAMGPATDEGFYGDFEFDELEIQLMVVQIGNKRELVGKYKAKGCKRVGTFYNRWYDTYCKYAEMYYFGNSIVRYGKKIMDKPDFSKPDKFKEEAFEQSGLLYFQ